jgi:hypothetical protein
LYAAPFASKSFSSDGTHGSVALGMFLYSAIGLLVKEASRYGINPLVWPHGKNAAGKALLSDEVHRMEIFFEKDKGCR